jgi:two-component system response regulator FixJ
MKVGRTVHIVEDHDTLREALELLLKGADFDVRSFRCAETFLAEIGRARPLCLLADVRLPGMDGIALYRHLVRLGATPAVVVITGHGDIPMAVSALKEGVVDFVEKPFEPAMLLESVGDAWQRAAANWQHKVAAADIDARRETLTTREAEVFAMLTEGHPNKVVAGALHISIRTAEHHRAHVMEKMKARSLSHLIKMSLKLP